MDAQGSTAAIPTRQGGGFLRIVSNSEIDRRQAEVANKEAAQKLQEFVIGLPEFHPLMKDTDQRLTQIRKLLDKNKTTLRPLHLL